MTPTYKELLGLREVSVNEFQSRFQELIDNCEPFIVRELGKHWPIVGYGQMGTPEVWNYLKRFSNKLTTPVYRAETSSKGRIGYRDDLRSFNFKVEQLSVSDLFELLIPNDIEAVGHLYAGSVLTQKYLPGFREDNDLPQIRSDSRQFAWIGNRTIASAHYDVLRNIAVCVAGRRRFTIFPPDQVKNLYVGPLDVTPAGQSISLVDFKAPDFETFPRFKDALDAGRTTLLEPGDAVYIPSLWWHHVESEADFGMLINYWWTDDSDGVGNPLNTLLHAFQSIRALPQRERSAWRAIFDHYIFDQDGSAMQHLSEEQRGLFGSLDREKAQRIRDMLSKTLKR